MTMAVIGSRGFEDYEFLCNTLDKFDNITTIVSGAAKGADALAAKYAKNRAIRLVEFPADWATHGKKAGFKRNHDIINNSAEVVAFWDGASTGTRHSVRLAQNQGKKVHIFWKGQDETV